VVAQENDIVLVPEGYHPVATAYGYDCYYLNFLAGSAQSLAATFDPAHDWTRETWDVQDPRVPLVHHKMEDKVRA
jgi:5-deoxy-glucuronate isomerase